MIVFWNHLFHLLIFLIAAMLSFGIYRVVRRKLEVTAPHSLDIGMPLHRRPVQAAVDTQDAPEVREDWKQSFRRELLATPAIIGSMLRRLRNKTVLQWIAMDMLIMVAVSTLLAMFSNSSIGGLDLYMSTYLPMMGVMLVLFTFTEAVHGNRVVAMITAVLILTGIALQGLLQLSDEQPSASQLVFFSVVSMFLAIFGCFLLRVFTVSDHRVSRIVLNIVLIGIYAVLMVAGEEIYGTKAWLVVGGISFQLTELTKVLSLMIFGLTFTDATLTAAGRLLSALITLAINGLFLLLANELGTLCILGIGFFVLGFMYLPDLKGLAMTVAMLALIATVGLFLCFQCEQIVNPPESAAAAQSEETAPSEETTPPEDTISPAADAEGAEDSVSVVDKLLNLGARIWRKFKLRLDLVIAPETVDPQAGGYQSDKAHNALMLSSWLGSVYNVDIPVVESDYIFTFLVLKMGAVYAILVLLMMLALLSNCLCRSLSNPRTGMGAVSAAFTLGIVLQSLIAASSAVGAFITVGLPFSFLSDGGTATVTNYMMTVFIIYSGSPAEAATDDGAKKDRPVRRENVS